MRKIFTSTFLLILIGILFFLGVSNSQAKSRRVNPVCSSAHLNGLSQSDVDKQTTLMQKAGINWVRFDFFWIDMEPQQGVYDFSKYDYIVNNAASKGIHVLALVSQYGIPSWYRQDSTNFMSPPQNPQDYGAFAKALATHFRGKIQLYEMGNEPDIALFWPPTPNVASYSALLKAGYTGVKAGDPNAKVISAGLTANDQTQWINAMYANGVKGYFDYFGYHPYTWPLSPDVGFGFNQLSTIQQIMQAHGDNKQIMATEVGWPSTTASGGVDEPTQASYIQRIFQKIEYENYQYVPIACIYDFIDDGTDQKNPENNFGILRNDYTQKPSFATMIQVRSDYNKNFITINP